MITFAIKLGNLHPASLRWTAVVVAGFPLLSSFVMFTFQGRLFTRLCGLNPGSPSASIAFLANSRFVPASLPVGRQK